MAAGGQEVGGGGGGNGGGGGGGGGTAVVPDALPPARPPLAPSRRLSRARENLLSTLQDRTGPLQPPLPRIRLTGRALTDLSLLSGSRHAAGSGNDDMADFRRGLGAARRKGTGGRGRAGRALECLTYTELQPPRDLTIDESTPRDTEVTPRSRHAPGDVPLAEGSGDAERGGCEGRLDYAQMPVTLTQLHRIMTSDRKKRNQTVPISGPGSDRRQYDTDLSDPQQAARPLQASNKTNIRISIKRDSKGETPAVRLTMKVTLPNIAQPPTTPSTDLAVKRRERLPAFVDRRRRAPAVGPTRKRVTIQNVPQHDQNGIVSVTYPDDCYVDDVRSSSARTPSVLRRLEATRGRPSDRTRRWLAENPVEDATFELPVTPAPPSSPTTPPLTQIPVLPPQPASRAQPRPKTQPATKPILPPTQPQSQLTPAPARPTTSCALPSTNPAPSPQRKVIKMRLRPRPTDTHPSARPPDGATLPPPPAAPPGGQVNGRVRLVSARGPSVSMVTTTPLATSTPRVTSTGLFTPVVRPTVTATYRTRGTGAVRETEL